MATNKLDSLKGLGIEHQYDVYDDMIYLRRIIPAVHQQMKIPACKMEFYSPNQLYNMFDQQHKSQDDYVHLGPTNKELRDPRIREAYEAMQIIRKLIGTKQ